FGKSGWPRHVLCAVGRYLVTRPHGTKFVPWLPSTRNGADRAGFQQAVESDMRLGDFDISVLSDGTFALDGGQVFGVVPKTLWEKKLSADSRNRVRMGLNCLLVRAGEQRVLIETGIGDKFDAKFAGIYDVQKPTTLLDQLQEH